MTHRRHPRTPGRGERAHTPGATCEGSGAEGSVCGRGCPPPGGSFASPLPGGPLPCLAASDGDTESAVPEPPPKPPLGDEGSPAVGAGKSASRRASADAEITAAFRCTLGKTLLALSVRGAEPADELNMNEWPPFGTGPAAAAARACRASSPSTHPLTYHIPLPPAPTPIQETALVPQWAFARSPQVKGVIPRATSRRRCSLMNC